MTVADVESTAQPATRAEPEPKPTLEARVYRLAALRVELASQQAKIDTAREIHNNAFQAMWAGELAVLDALKASATEEDAALRTEAEAVFLATGNKHPVKGVEIKETKVYSYDPDECLRWAIEAKHAALLKLDDAALKKVAETLRAPSFRVTIIPKANIAKELPPGEADHG